MLKKLGSANLSLVWFYLGILIFFSALSPHFRTIANFQNILKGFSHIGIMAVGVAFTILIGGIDLSVGSLMGLTGMVVYDLILILGLPGWVGILAALATGVLAGAVNAFLVVRIRLQPFIATLGTLVMFRGITWAISGRQMAARQAAGSSMLAITDPLYLGIDGSIGPVPLALVYLILIVVVAHLVLHHTKLGMDLYAVGGNENAARLAGVNIDRVKFVAFVICGFLTAVAALVLTSRMTTSNEDLGTSFEFSAIAAAVMGGVSLSGGVGNPLGPALAAFIIGTMYIGLTLIGMPTYMQQVMAGFILVAAVGYDRFLETRRTRQWLKRQQAGVEEGWEQA